MFITICLGSAIGKRDTTCSPKNTRYAVSVLYCVHLKYALAFSGGKIILSQGEGGGG